MDFRISEEQTALQDSLKRYLAKDYSFEKRRELLRAPEGFSRDAWRQYAEFGVLALPFPEDAGGLGGSAVDTMVVMEAFGPALVLEPYLATVVLAGGLVRDAGSGGQKQSLLPAVAEGRLLLAFAHGEPGVRYDLDHVATTARADGEGWVLDGAKAVVLHGAAADRLIVSARSAGGARDAKGISLFIVERDAPGVSVRGYPTQDGSPAADIVLESVRVPKDALLGARDQALPAIERAVDYANAALCAEAVGIMAALNAATLEYLKTRKQFGVPIGKFQALQHRMVDMTIAAEQARSMMYLAAVRADSADAGERRRALAAAKAFIGQAARFVGQQAVQLHGGMGVTDELIVSHWFKRLTAIDLTFGDADHQLARFSDTLLAETAEAQAPAQAGRARKRAG